MTSFNAWSTLRFDTRATDKEQVVGARSVEAGRFASARTMAQGGEPMVTVREKSRLNAQAAFARMVAAFRASLRALDLSCQSPVGLLPVGLLPDRSAQAHAAMWVAIDVPRPGCEVSGPREHAVAIQSCAVPVRQDKCRRPSDAALRPCH